MYCCCLDRFDEAIKIHEEIVKMFTTAKGADHPLTGIGLSWLANSYYQAGKLELAAESLGKAVKLLDGAVKTEQYMPHLTRYRTILQQLNRGDEAKVIEAKIAKLQSA